MLSECSRMGSWVKQSKSPPPIKPDVVLNRSYLYKTVNHRQQGEGFGIIDSYGGWAKLIFPSICCFFRAIELIQLVDFAKNIADFQITTA